MTTTAVAIPENATLAMRAFLEKQPQEVAAKFLYLFEFDNDFDILNIPECNAECYVGEDDDEDKWRQKDVAIWTQRKEFLESLPDDTVVEFLHACHEADPEQQFDIDHCLQVFGMNVALKVLRGLSHMPYDSKYSSFFRVEECRQEERDNYRREYDIPRGSDDYRTQKGLRRLSSMVRGEALTIIWRYIFESMGVSADKTLGCRLVRRAMPEVTPMWQAAEALEQVEHARVQRPSGTVTFTPNQVAFMIEDMRVHIRAKYAAERDKIENERKRRRIAADDKDATKT